MRFSNPTEGEVAVVWKGSDAHGAAPVVEVGAGAGAAAASAALQPTKVDVHLDHHTSAPWPHPVATGSPSVSSAEEGVAGAPVAVRRCRLTSR